MKRIYIHPQTLLIPILSERIMAASEVIIVDGSTTQPSANADSRMPFDLLPLAE